MLLQTLIGNKEDELVIPVPGTYLVMKWSKACSMEENGQMRLGVQTTTIGQTKISSHHLLKIRTVF